MTTMTYPTTGSRSLVSTPMATSTSLPSSTPRAVCSPPRVSRSTAAGNRALLAWITGHGELDPGRCRRHRILGSRSDPLPPRPQHRRGRGRSTEPSDRRRQKGKSDTIDAEAAARAALNGTAAGAPKSRDGDVEAIRALRVVRRTAMRTRVQAIHQLRALTSTAPQALRDQLRGLNRPDLIETCGRFRVTDATDPRAATRFALRELARRITQLDEELARLDGQIKPLVTRACPELLELRGVGADTAAILLVTAGDNPHRLRNEASFAKLCGVAPLEASSGQRPSASPQPRWRPPSQPCALAHRARPHGLRRTHPRLRRPPPRRRTQHPRDHALPQALHRPRGLPHHHRTRSRNAPLTYRSITARGISSRVSLPRLWRVQQGGSIPRRRCCRTARALRSRTVARFKRTANV